MAVSTALSGTALPSRRVAFALAAGALAPGNRRTLDTAVPEAAQPGAPSASAGESSGSVGLIRDTLAVVALPTVQWSRAVGRER